MNGKKWSRECWAMRRKPVRTITGPIVVTSGTTVDLLALPGLMPRFLFWLTARLPAREIRGEHGEPYLERYYLFSVLGWRAYLHRFRASDPDRGLHDHPWGHSLSLVLAGGYRELRHYSYRILPPGSLNVIRGHDFHRILLDPGREAWTLFLHGPRTKGWGFWRNGVYTLFAKSKDDYPSHHWWKTAQRGQALRNQPHNRSNP